MKRTLIILICLILTGSMMFGAEPEAKAKKFMVQINGSLLFPADGNYKDVYGSSVFVPGVQAGYLVSNNILIWAGYEYISGSGTTPVLEEEARSTQHFISLGAGYMGEFSDNLGFQVLAGVMYVSYKEEALGEEVSGSAIGIALQGGLVMKFGGGFFGTVFLGYGYASDEVEGVTIKPGGFKTGIGLGICF